MDESTGRSVSLCLTSSCGSDGALMDVAPVRVCVVLQWAGDGVVGFFVMSFGVLVWRVVRACHPAAGQAQPQLDPAFPVLSALWAAGREWLDMGGGGNVNTAAQATGVVPVADRWWHQAPRHAVLVAMCGPA